MKSWPTWRQVGSPNRAKIHKKSTQKSIKKSMAFKNDFLLDFDSFLGGKWSQVGSKIVSEIDVNFERPIFTKTYKNQWIFNDFCGFGEASWVRKSIKNRLKIEVNFGRHLGIDFLSILDDLGAKLGRKIEL